ncbi:hypothetical protein PF004_g16722 [Phytophthora fragariae]|uniref:Uncharacterized protein n=1 Tax=Phytophthora fragariae TaxID=53985 RepID=A0A6G0NHJ9_9STRA|nr:hypothetical protein PF004_g16722 [Phytophthora fragariae]
MPRKIKHVGNLTFQHKKKICEWRAAHPSLTQRDLAQKALRDLALAKAPTQGTISNILKEVPGRTSSHRSQQEGDEMLNTTLVVQMRALRIRDPMNIDTVVCNPAEENTEMEVMSADDLLSGVCDAALVGSARHIQDDDMEELEVVVTPLESLTTADRVDAVRSVIFMLAEHPDVDLKAMEGLRTIQRRVCDELRAEREAALKQTSIRGFFSMVE